MTGERLNVGEKKESRMTVCPEHLLEQGRHMETWGSQWKEQVLRLKKKISGIQILLIELLF